MSDLRDFTGKNRKFTGTIGERISTGTTGERDTATFGAGTLRFNSSTNLLEYYDGSAWREVRDLNNVITTQGDVLYRDASGLARLAAGTSGQFLKTNGSAANPAWATVSSSILQVKQAVKVATEYINTTALTQVSNLTATLTPSSVSNKILVQGVLVTSGDTSTTTGTTLVQRDIGGGGYSTIGGHSGVSGQTAGHGHTGPFNGTWNLATSAICFLDAPATTSAVSYSWFIKSEQANNWINRTGRDSDVNHPRGISTVVLMEIASSAL